MVTSYEDVRPEVKAFAVLMERELRENDHKGGWLGCDVDYLLSKLVEEFGELYAAVYGGSSKCAPSEAADLANIAMMLCDVQGALDVSADAPASTRYAELERAARAVAEGLRAAIEWIIAGVCQKRCNQPGCESPDEQCAYHLHLMRESLIALAALDAEATPDA